MTRLSVRALVAIAVLLTGVTTAAIAPAAAQSDSDDPVLSGAFDSENATVRDVLSGGYAAAKAYGDRIWFDLSGGVAGDAVPFLARDATSAAEQATAVTTYYNEHNETLEEYVNSRKDLSRNSTVEVTWQLDGETATRYVVANSTGSNVTTEMVSSTNRTVDETATVCGFAAASSYEELKHFTEEYAEPDKDVDAAYLGRLKGRYGEDVETSLYPSSGTCDGGDT